MQRASSSDPVTQVVSERMALRPDAQLELREDGSASIRCQFTELPLPPLPPSVGNALRLLATPPGLRMAELIREVTAGGHAVLPRGLWLLNELRRWALLSRSVEAGDRPVMTAVPIGIEEVPPVPASGTMILSRFALLRRDGADFVLESPLSHHRVIVHDPALLSILAHLGMPFERERLGEQFPDMAPALVTSVISLLNDVSLLSAVGNDGIPAEEQPPWRSWEVHDLYFHSRSRRGRHSNPYAGTYRWASDAPPALKPPSDEPVIELPVPDPANVADPSLETVLRTRRSIRKHGPTPISREQLGEFLYRALRVTERVANESGEWTRRPYPGGGALYELEVYPVIGACAGIEPGLYHYRPGDHALSRVKAATPQVVQLLREAGATAMMQETPHVLLVIACRFARLTSKYESMAYALCLKDVGVMLQTMYLVATAMGLAPCALGGGDSDLFARASGLPYLVEGSVGEFLLGSSEAV